MKLWDCIGNIRSTLERSVSRSTGGASGLPGTCLLPVDQRRRRWEARRGHRLERPTR